MSLKKFQLTILGLILAISLVQCVKKTPQAGGLVEHQGYAVKFWGYRTSVLVKAGPAEIDAYNSDAGNLIQSGGNVGLKIASGDKFEKVGDRVVYQSELMGKALTISCVMAKYDPGKEQVFVCLLNESIMAFIRYQMKPLGQNSKLTIELEVEETNPLLTEMIEQVKLKETVMKLQDEAIARLQMHFDPSLKREDLQSENLRGEPIEKLYPAHQATIWINAPATKVAEYLASPAFTEMMKQKFNIDFDRAFMDQKPGTYRLSVNFLGTESHPDAFILSYQKEKHIIAYWTAKLNSRIQIYTKPRKGGTEFTLAFMTESPSAVTMELANIVMNNAQIPNIVEAALIEIKTAVEGAV